jgi:hypothetical protein
VETLSCPISITPTIVGGLPMSVKS